MRPNTLTAAHARVGRGLPSTSDDPRRAWAARMDAGHVPTIRTEEPDDGPAQLYLYDPIDDWFGITSSDFRAALDGVGAGDIDLHINCPGGDAFDGVAILNMLRQHDGNVTAIVDGLAASAASYIAVGVDQTVMAPNATMMIHDAWGICVGPAAEMDKMADELDMVSDNIAGIYADKSGDPVDTWRDLMRAETWYVDSEAVDAGLADSVLATAAEPAASKRAARGSLVAARAGRRNGPPTPSKWDLHAVPSNIAAAHSGPTQ